MAQIIVGTSGFSYRDWRTAFYPEGVKQEDLIEYYARHFRAVELNYSYYRLPDPSLSKRMVQKTNKKIEFSIKAYQGITHEVSDDSLGSTTSRFLEGIRPFSEEGLLGAILLQFPQSFHYTVKNRIYLKSVIDRLESYPVVVEFRQKEWMKESVFKSLRAMDTGFVCVDEPELPSLIPPMAINTSGLGYVRFHGKNRKNWYGTDSTMRYDYMYSEDELRGWIPKIREIAKNTDKVYVFFNNHAKAQAVNNAKMLINLLE